MLMARLYEVVLSALLKKRARAMLLQQDGRHVSNAEGGKSGKQGDAAARSSRRGGRAAGVARGRKVRAAKGRHGAAVRAAYNPATRVPTLFQASHYHAHVSFLRAAASFRRSC